MTENIDGWPYGSRREARKDGVSIDGEYAKREFELAVAERRLTKAFTVWKQKRAALKRLQKRLEKA